MEKCHATLVGTYRYHYKDSQKTYEIIGIGFDTERAGKVILYKALYTVKNLSESEYGNPVIFVRPRDVFFETVQVDGNETPRFSRIENK